MRKYLKKLGWICLPLMVIALLMEIMLRHIPNDYVLKKQYLDTHAAEIETLILGSSHSYFGLDPIYFSSLTFNASHISQTLDYDFEIIKKYRSEMRNLKAIVLPISSFTLFARMHKSLEVWRVKNYVLYYNMNTATSLKNYSELLSIPFKYSILRLVSYYLKGTDEITSTALGWGTSYSSEKAKDLDKTAKTAAFIHSGGLNTIDTLEVRKIFKENEVILEELLDWCESKNVVVLFVTPPGYVSYRNLLRKGQMDLTSETMKNLQLKHEHCLYLNLFADTNFVASDYYDADHLSEIGAKKFSKKVDLALRKLKNP